MKQFWHLTELAIKTAADFALIRSGDDFIYDIFGTVSVLGGWGNILRELRCSFSFSSCANRVMKKMKRREKCVGFFLSACEQIRYNRESRLKIMKNFCLLISRRKDLFEGNFPEFCAKLLGKISNCCKNIFNASFVILQVL